MVKRLEIVVPGKSTTTRNTGTANRVIKINGHKFQGSGADYVEKLLYSTKCAMIEQGWELTDKPIYVALILRRAIVQSHQETYMGMSKRQRKQALVTLATPSVENVLRQHLSVLQGVVFNKISQITSVFVLRLYDDEPRTEIVFGQPETVKELLNDVRNL